jgi:diguanylate cyclase (GGDEF)-like protein
MKNELQLSLSQKEFDNLTQALKLAFDNHLQWLSDLNFSMVCEPENLTQFCYCEKPYHTCKFGQWYYSVDNVDIREHIDFINLGKKHKKLHLIVCSLVKEFHENNKPSKTTYLEFKKIEELFLEEFKSFLHSNLSAFNNEDHLTELPNRHALDTILKQEYSQMKRKSYHSSIAILDIDFFKLVNDKYGHNIGDEVLKKFAQLLTTHVRSCDFVARYGGEEFIIYFPNIDCKTAFDIAEKLRELIYQNPIKVSGNKLISLTCSFGIASFNENKPIKQSIADADQALYQAKNSGRNNVVIYNH